MDDIFCDDACTAAVEVIERHECVLFAGKILLQFTKVVCVFIDLHIGLVLLHGCPIFCVRVILEREGVLRPFQTVGID